MMNLRATLKLAHSLLDHHKIPHALIGGLALACYGSTRATVDLDLLIREEHKEKVKDLLMNNPKSFTKHFKPIHVTSPSPKNPKPVSAHRPVMAKIIPNILLRTKFLIRGMFLYPPEKTLVRESSHLSIFGAQ